MPLRYRLCWVRGSEQPREAAASQRPAGRAARWATARRGLKRACRSGTISTLTAQVGPDAPVAPADQGLDGIGDGIVAHGRTGHGTQAIQTGAGSGTGSIAGGCTGPSSGRITMAERSLPV